MTKQQIRRTELKINVESVNNFQDTLKIKVSLTFSQKTFYCKYEMAINFSLSVLKYYDWHNLHEGGALLEYSSGCLGVDSIKSHHTINNPTQQLGSSSTEYTAGNLSSRPVIQFYNSVISVGFSILGLINLYNYPGRALRAVLGKR